MVALFILLVLIFNSRISISLDSLGVSQSIHDGESLISADGTFEGGFFGPENSTRRYFGIWYKNVSPLTVVWVANREKPLQNNPGALKLNCKGVLVIFNATNNTLWSSTTSSKAVNNPVAQLLDSGNLVVKNGQDNTEINKENLLWQSFHSPCDTFLPGMKIGWNLETGVERYLSSWRSDDDPGEGQYTLKIDLRGYPQFFELDGSVNKTRPGSWNGVALTGYPTPQLTQDYRHEFVINEKEVYYEYIILNRSIFYILRLTPSGVAEGLSFGLFKQKVERLSHLWGVTSATIMLFVVHILYAIWMVTLHHMNVSKDLHPSFLSNGTSHIGLVVVFETLHWIVMTQTAS